MALSRFAERKSRSRSRMHLSSRSTRGLDVKARKFQGWDLMYSRTIHRIDQLMHTQRLRFKLRKCLIKHTSYLKRSHTGKHKKKTQFTNLFQLLSSLSKRFQKRRFKTRRTETTGSQGCLALLEGKELCNLQALCLCQNEQPPLSPSLKRPAVWSL